MKQKNIWSTPFDELTSNDLRLMAKKHWNPELSKAFDIIAKAYDDMDENSNLVIARHQEDYDNNLN